MHTGGVGGEALKGVGSTGPTVLVLKLRWIPVAGNDTNDSLGRIMILGRVAIHVWQVGFFEIRFGH